MGGFSCIFLTDPSTKVCVYMKRNVQTLTYTLHLQMAKSPTTPNPFWLQFIICVQEYYPVSFMLNNIYTNLIKTGKKLTLSQIFHIVKDK